MENMFPYLSSDMDSSKSLALGAWPLSPLRAVGLLDRVRNNAGRDMGFWRALQLLAFLES